MVIKCIMSIDNEIVVKYFDKETFEKLVNGLNMFVELEILKKDTIKILGTELIQIIE